MYWKMTNSMKIKIMVLGLIFLCGSMGLFAQPVEISGKVVIWNDIPLQNITIEAAKSKAETVSNDKGEFMIEINKKDKLRFSADGFVNEKVKVKPGMDDLIVKMELISNEYGGEDEPVNDGFRYIPEDYKARAIKTIKELSVSEMVAYGSVWDMIRGKIPGVVIADNEVYIREGLSGSIDGRRQPAVVVLNGMQVASSTINNLYPHDIKSISLLKGGAASIYGGNGANGVIVIKTK